MADPTVPVQVTFALLGLKALEFSALLSGGVAKAKTHKERYDLITAAYQSELKFLRLLIWLRPGIMITTGVLLVVVTIWLDLIIFGYYSSGSLNPSLGKTYPYVVGISIVAVLTGLVVYVVTSFSWAKIYNSFRFVLPKSQYQQRLASRIDRDTDGYFYVNNEQSEKIARRIVEAVLKDPSWYKQSIVYTPTTTSVWYANFLFFGELVEARAAAGKAMERWRWISEIYEAQPDFFSAARLKKLKEEGKFAATLVDEMKKHSPPPEAFGTGLTKVLDSGVASLAKFKYDARNIAQMNAWNKLLIAAKRRTRYDVVNKRLTKFDPYQKRSGNRLVLIKLMVSRKVWDIPVKELEFPFSAWQCVFLLRSKVINTDLEKFSTYDPDFAWFRNAALRKLTASVEESIAALSKAEKGELKKILDSELTPSAAMHLTDTFLWKVGDDCCQVNQCGKGSEKVTVLERLLDTWNLAYSEAKSEKEPICPFTKLAICDPAKHKELFYYEAPNFELK